MANMECRQLINQATELQLTWGLAVGLQAIHQGLRCDAGGRKFPIAGRRAHAGETGLVCSVGRIAISVLETSKRNITTLAALALIAHARRIGSAFGRLAARAGCSARPRRATASARTGPRVGI